MCVSSTMSFSRLMSRISVVLPPPAGPNSTVIALSGISMVTPSREGFPAYQ